MRQTVRAPHDAQSKAIPQRATKRSEAKPARISGPDAAEAP